MNSNFTSPYWNEYFDRPAEMAVKTVLTQAQEDYADTAVKPSVCARVEVEWLKYLELLQDVLNDGDNYSTREILIICFPPFAAGMLGAAINALLQG